MPMGYLSRRSRQSVNCSWLRPVAADQPSRSPARGLRGTLFTRGSLYILAVILRQSAALILITILVATISGEDFTRFGLMLSGFALLVPLLTLNIHVAPTRLYFDSADTQVRANLLKSSLVGALCLGFVGVSVFLILLGVVGSWEPVSGGSTWLQLGMALVILGMIVTQYGATFFRIRGNAGMFLLLALGQSFVVVVAFLLIFRLTNMGIASLVWAFVVAQTASALFVLASSKTLLARGRVTRQAVSQSFHFAWPTAVHLVALWGISGSGRWIGAYYLPLEELATFTLVTQLVIVFGGLARAVFDTRLPEIASGFASPDVSKGVNLVTKTTWLAGALVLAAYGGVGFLLFVLAVPMPAAYAPSLPLVLLALLASLWDVAYLRGVQILHYSKHTKTQATATLLSGSLVVLLSFTLVVGYGDMGLLFAVVGGMALQALFSNGFARYALRQEGLKKRSTLGRS